MPVHKTKFSQTWLEKMDPNGISVRRWLKQGVNDSTFICTICKTGELDCGNKGWHSIEQHMAKNKHCDNMKLIKENTTFVSGKQSSNTHLQQSSTTLISTVTLAHPTKTISFQDQVTRAEALWAINAAQHGYSYHSCDEAGDLFRTMFPDSKIAEQFSMERTKMSYVVSHGLGPYFHRDLVNEVKRCERFVLCFDEQTNNQNNKQLDLLLKYWSIQKNTVVTRYYKSVLLGHAPATVIRDCILESFKTDGIELKRLLMIGRDNPNVNKSLEGLIDEEMKKVGGELLKIGPCHIHVVHNAFKAGTTASQWHIENICTGIWSWFRQSPARKEDFLKIIDELNDTMEKTILYFVATRWVLLGKVIDRVLKHWDVLGEYFLVYLPAHEKAQTVKNTKYDAIKSNLSSHVSKTRLLFISYICRTIFDKLLTWFQQEGPLIHLLHQELSDLYRTVLLSFLTPHSIGNKQGGELLSIDYTLTEKQLDNKQIRIGEETRKSLSLLSKEERDLFIQHVKTIYHAIAVYLKLNLPLNNSFLRDVQILDSSRRSDPCGADAIVRIGRSVTGLLSSDEIDFLRDEWLLYSLETIDESWIIKRNYRDSDGKERLEYQRIDFYWHNVLSILRNNGQLKYPTMAKLIKNILIISHGNADVERGFSINQNILTDNRTLLSEKSINGLRSTHDAVRSNGFGSAHKMPIGIDAIRSVQKSASLYKEEMLRIKALVAVNEQENKQRENVEVEKKKLLEHEKELMTKHHQLQSEQKAAQLLTDEGARRLENSLKKGDLTDAQAAHALIKTGNEKLTAISEEMSKTMEELSKVQQKRAHAEHEQVKKKQKLAHKQYTIVSDRNGN